MISTLLFALACQSDTQLKALDDVVTPTIGYGDISGRVCDPTGYTWLEGATVFVNIYDDEGWLTEVKITTTDEDGWWSLSELPTENDRAVSAARSVLTVADTTKAITCKNTTTTVGSGPLRFLLTFTPEQPHSCYGIIVVNTESLEDVESLMERTRTYIGAHFPEADPLVIPFNLSGGPVYEVAARFSGDDPAVLRELSMKARRIMSEHPKAKNIRDNWRNRIPVWRPGFSQMDAQHQGLTRPDVADALLRLTDGVPVGTFRDGDRLIPIRVRAPESERSITPDLENVPVCGGAPASRPLGSVIGDGEIQMHDAMIHRYDRIRTITVQCNPKPGITTVKLRNDLASKLQAIPLPPGYTLSWGGMYEFANESNNSVYAQVPLSVALMLVFVVLLFNGVRQPLIIILTLPLSLIGITAGLLLTHKGFGFMAMLGMLSLIGMMIRNAVILIGEIDLWIAA